VHNASIDIKEGEICVLMGLSGSGKSSLLRAINGLNKTSRGQLLVRDGDNMVDVASCDSSTLLHLRSHKISMVFQNFALMPWLSVLDNVAFGLEMQGITKQQRHQKAMQQLKMVGLDEWADKRPNQLSGGMQQRVGLARAFTMDTDILLMDEPFSALDPLIRNQLQDELIELQQKLKKTIVFVSHDLDEALKIGSKIGIMESAQIIQYDIPENIVLNPANAYVQDFVAHTNPLNVLKAHSLMTPLSALVNTANNAQQSTVIIDQQQQIELTIDRQQQLLHVTLGGQVLGLQFCTGEQDIQQLSTSSITIIASDTSMRRAIEIKHHTGLPIILAEREKVLGMLNDKSFYHALLGKHFQTDFSEAS
jgi:glycine betaine/proline transport system ATP-binding protein